MAKSKETKPDLITIEEMLLTTWVETAQEDPQFSKIPFTSSKQFFVQSKVFLKQLLTAVDDDIIPDLSAHELDPIFKLWHQIRAEHNQKGLSVKDTALLIFSFKSSLVKYAKTFGLPEKKAKQLSTILDLMGRLTFDIYSVEQEQRIGRQHNQIEYLQQKRSVEKFGQLIGTSPVMKQLYKVIGLVLENDVSILLEGESGTGKDLVANIIHSHSKRKKGPFIAVNCGAIPKTLIESELFGHEKGSFTGALEKRLGKFELADGGTLFLDEIAELPLAQQVKLLRVLQTQEFERVGGTTKIKTDVRIIAATNKDLKQAVDNQKFRLDLYYRLHVFPITIPPLRERGNDIIQLADYFLNHYATAFKLDPPILTKECKQHLKLQPWHGNIRELENMMQRIVIIASGQPVTIATLEYQPGQSTLLQLESPTKQNPLTTSKTPTEIEPLDTLEKHALENALRVKSGNIQQAAKALGISRATFYNKVKKYEINIEK